MNNKGFAKRLAVLMSTAMIASSGLFCSTASMLPVQAASHSTYAATAKTLAKAALKATESTSAKKATGTAAKSTSSAKAAAAGKTATKTAASTKAGKTTAKSGKEDATDLFVKATAGAMYAAGTLTKEQYTYITALPGKMDATDKQAAMNLLTKYLNANTLAVAGFYFQTHDLQGLKATGLALMTPQDQAMAQYLWVKYIGL